MHAACFLDRDGVLVEDVGYLADPDDLVLLDGAARSVRRLNEASVPVVVVTNQAGVARGCFPEARIAEVHDRLLQMLRAFDARIDRFYYCPHHPTAGGGSYTIDCECRKPKPGMLLRAAAELDLDLPRSVFVGDKASDLEAGMAAGCRTILVRSGYGDTVQDTELEALAPMFVATGIADAVDFALPSLTGAGTG